MIGIQNRKQGGVRKGKRNRYSLAILLKGITKKSMKAIKKETEWAREGSSVGCEKL